LLRMLPMRRADCTASAICWLTPVLAHPLHAPPQPLQPP